MGRQYSLRYTLSSLLFTLFLPALSSYFVGFCSFPLHSWVDKAVKDRKEKRLIQLHSLLVKAEFWLLTSMQVCGICKIRHSALLQ